MKKRSILYILSAIICAALLASAGLCLYKKARNYLLFQNTLQTLATAQYQSIFLSMYDISTFSEEDFAVSRGVPTRKLDYVFQNAEEMNLALEKAFHSGNHITNVYLGLDPLQHREDSDMAKLQEAFRGSLLTYAGANPEITFEILFSFPSMEYWMTLEESETEAALTLYAQFVDILCVQDNIRAYYVGGQDWLICNPANYVSNLAVKEAVSHKLFLHTFCDNSFQITAENKAEMLQQTRDEIAAARKAPAEYPDLSQYDIVFIGDSIIGNNTGSLSVPVMVSEFSGASAFNCAQSGTSAAESESEGALCFPKIVNEFLSGQPESPEATYGQGILEYTSASHSHKKLCFVIDFGLNDYFYGLPLEDKDDSYNISTYAGAMRTGIATLKKEYPDAMYIIMGPGQTTYFADGTEPQSQEGNQLSAYYNQAKALSEELGAAYIDLYHEFPEGESTLADVLADGCHYNEHGRFLLTQKILRTIAAYLGSS